MNNVDGEQWLTMDRQGSTINCLWLDRGSVNSKKMDTTIDLCAKDDESD